MAERKCDNCAHRESWRAVYSRVQVGPQAFAVADCPHAYGGQAGVTPGSGTHCPKFTPRATGVQGAPADHKLVPIEPTDGMLVWLCDGGLGNLSDEDKQRCLRKARARYKAMLVAAPDDAGEFR